MGMTDAENANKSSKSSSSSASKSNSDGRGSQREARSSAASAKSTSTSQRSGTSNSDGRGSQREQRTSAASAASSRSSSDGRGSQREQVTSGKTQQLADRVGASLASIGQSITGKMRDVNSATMMQSINSFTAGLSGIDPTPKSASISGLSGNAAVIGNALARLGRAPHEIAGILGRLTQESSLNPNAVRYKDNKKYKGELANSVGIGQWNGPRQQALKAFANKKGTDWKDLETQAEFLDYELKTSPDEARARAAMAAATTPAEAAAAMMHYERPLHYKPNNPTAGHGWNNTLSYANDYAGKIGDFNPDSVANTPSSLGAKKDSASYSLGSALRGVFDDSSGPLSGGGEAPEEMASDSNYRDPYASTPAGRAKRNEAAYKPKTQDEVKDPRRGGFGGLEVALKSDDPLAVGKNIVGALQNPVGYVLDTIQDSVRNSQEWNSEGPEGQPMSLGERVAGFFNSSTVDQSYRSGGKSDNSTNKGEGRKSSSSSQKSTTTPAVKPTTSSVDLYSQLLTQLTNFNVDTGTTETGKRKPYEWSTI